MKILFCTFRHVTICTKSLIVRVYRIYLTRPKPSTPDPHLTHPHKIGAPSRVTMATLKLLLAFTYLLSATTFALAPQGGRCAHCNEYLKLPPDGSTVSRRDALTVAGSLSASTSALALFGGLSTPMVFPQPANAVFDQTLQDLLASLSKVPTFCIVTPEGASYMLAKEDFARGYAFTTLKGAEIVLEDAQRTANKEGYGDVWKDAKITVIPADIALRLTLQQKKRTSQKESTMNTILEIIPGAEQRQQGIDLDRKYTDQGKVPLFYLDSDLMKSPDGNSDTTPLFFDPNDLLAQWTQQYGEKSIPPKIKVLELGALFQYVLRQRQNEIPVRTSRVTFIPSSRSLEDSKELKSKGSLAPYKVDRMII